MGLWVPVSFLASDSILTEFRASIVVAFFFLFCYSKFTATVFTLSLSFPEIEDRTLRRPLQDVLISGIRGFFLTGNDLDHVEVRFGHA